MAGNQPTHDLATLLRVTTERPLEPDEFASLETLLLEDNDARAQYRQYMQVDALLQWRLGNAVGSRHITLTEAVDETPQPAPSYTASRSWAGTGRWLGNVAATLAVTLVFWGVFFLFFVLRPNSVEMVQKPSETAVESTKPIVAELVETFDAVWRGDSQLQPTAGTPLRQGDMLNLAAGLVQIRFESGALVTLEGPATFVLAERNAARMKLGCTFARASGDALGFTIETPAATVVDLGTEFGVMVERDGSTEVHVFSGLVEATPRTPSRQSSGEQSLVLEEGRAARIAMAQGKFETLAAKAEDFVRLQQPGWGAGELPPSADATPQIVLTGPVGHDLTDAEENGRLAGAISGGGENATKESYGRAFDNDIETKWLAFKPMGTYVVFRFADGEQHVVRSYTITSANDAPERDPYCWWLSGSQDGKHFTRLDGGTAQWFAASDLASSPWQRFETRAFAVPGNETAYRYYRFDFFTPAGARAAFATRLEIPNSIQIAEIELFDVDVTQRQPTNENPE